MDVGETLHLATIFGAPEIKRQDTFINSMAYYLLTGRQNAKLYSNGSNYVATCEHPHRPSTTLIFPEIGNNPGPLTAQLLLYLQPENRDFQLARYTDHDFHCLKAALSLLANRDIANIKMINEDYLDWKFPGHILSTEQTGNMRGNSFDKVRNKFNKIANEVDLIELRAPEGRKTMEASLYFWIGGLLAHGNADAKSNMGFYESLIENIDKYPQIFDGFIVNFKGEPVGFTVWDTSVAGTANSLASISRRSLKGLSEFQIISACKLLHEKGITAYNLGGSETEALDRHKRKFMPISSYDAATYQIEFLRPRPRDLQTWNLV